MTRHPAGRADSGRLDGGSRDYQWCIAGVDAVGSRPLYCVFVLGGGILF